MSSEGPRKDRPHSWPGKTTPGAPGIVFVSYAHADEEWKNLLETHLGVLALQGLAEVRTDRGIGAGKPWEKEILEDIDSAHVALLLISADFLSSRFIMETEVPRILERHRAGELAVVPVLVRPCVWEVVPWLREIQMLPWGLVPLLMQPTEGLMEAEVTAVTREIQGILEGRGLACKVLEPCLHASRNADALHSSGRGRIPGSVEENSEMKRKAKKLVLAKETLSPISASIVGGALSDRLPTACAPTLTCPSNPDLCQSGKYPC